jgi:hypothetical protein
MGFNCVRLPYADDQFDRDPEPEVLDRFNRVYTSEEIFYMTVGAITNVGLMVIFYSETAMPYGATVPDRQDKWLENLEFLT